MNRLRWLFGGLLLVFLLPVWRWIDLVIVFSPFKWPILIAQILCFSVFLLYPIKLFFPKIKPRYLSLIFGCFLIIAYLTPSLSRMATQAPDHNHCGSLSFTGSFYPLRSILTDAYQDDLEARNQQCWLRKMISKVPESFQTEQDLKLYTDLIDKRLLLPSIKYRASLPFMAFLYYRIYSKSQDFLGMKKVYDSVNFWLSNYTEEIGIREYSAFNWPHSTYIKFEYGLIERNWESLVGNIQFEEVIYR